MSEPTKPASPAPAFDKQKLLDKLNEVVAYQEQFAGVPNHNPFLWIKNHLTPLHERLMKGEQTPELKAAIESIKLEPCLINPELANKQPALKVKLTLSPTGQAVVNAPVAGGTTINKK